jgi:hypothetical protein
MDNDPNPNPNPNPYSTPGSDVFASSSALGGEGITEGVLEQLRKTKGWVKFLGVMAFIGAALMVVLGVVIMAGGAFGAAFAGQAGAELGPWFTAIIGLIYIVMALLYIYPGMKLWKYGKTIDRLLEDRASVTLEAALNEQRSLWKFCGIMMIIMLSLYIVAAIVAVIAIGAAAAMAS